MDEELNTIAPWECEMRSVSHTLDQYCLKVEPTATYKVILDPKASTSDKLWAYSVDFNHKTTVLHPQAIPQMYWGFILLLFITGGLTIFVLFRESKKIFEVLIETYLKRLEIKSNSVPIVYRDNKQENPKEG